MKKKEELSKGQLGDIVDRCMQAWEKLDRVEIIMKDFDNNIEGIGTLVSNVVKDIKNCKTKIKEINTTIFFDDGKK